MNFWPKGSHGKLQAIHAVAKTFGFSPYIYGKIPLLKTISSQFIEHKDVDLVASASIVGIGRFSVLYQRRKVNSKPATNRGSIQVCKKC